MDTDLLIAHIRLGHGLLVGCAALYLAWWTIFFRPDAGKVEGALYAVGVACIVGAAACGIAAVALILTTLPGFPVAAGRTPIPGWVIAVAAVVGYIALAAFTKGVFDRPITTELMLLVGWAALEAAVINTLLAAGSISSGTAIALGVVVTILFIATLVCYVLYYHLAPLPSFIDGAAPLLAVGAASAVMVVLLG